MVGLTRRRFLSFLGLAPVVGAVASVAPTLLLPAETQPRMTATEIRFGELRDPILELRRNVARAMNKIMDEAILSSM